MYCTLTRRRLAVPVGAGPLHRHPHGAADEEEGTANRRAGRVRIAPALEGRHLQPQVRDWGYHARCVTQYVPIVRPACARDLPWSVDQSQRLSVP